MGGCLLAIVGQHNSMWSFPPPAGHDGGCTSVLQDWTSCLPLGSSSGGGAGRSKISCVRRQFKELYLGGPARRKIIGRHGFNSHNNFCSAARWLQAAFCAVTAPCKRCRCPIPPIPKRPAHAMHRLSETAGLIIAACPAC